MPPSVIFYAPLARRAAVQELIVRRGVDHVVPAAPYVVDGVEPLLAPNLKLECSGGTDARSWLHGFGFE